VKEDRMPKFPRAELEDAFRSYVRREAGIEIYRVSFNRWELERRDGAWLVARRTTRLLGHEEAQGLLKGAVPRP